MNLDVLDHIVANDPGFIESLAEEKRLDGTASVGIAKMLISNGGDLSKLLEKQKYHYEKCIKPLIEEVQCEGIFGPETCMGSRSVDDELLLGCYIDGQFRCQICQYDAERIEAE